jgi:hypothetical protein
LRACGAARCRRGTRARFLLQPTKGKSAKRNEKRKENRAAKQGSSENGSDDVRDDGPENITHGLASVSISDEASAPEQQQQVGKLSTTKKSAETSPSPVKRHRRLCQVELSKKLRNLRKKLKQIEEGTLFTFVPRSHETFLNPCSSEND